MTEQRVLKTPRLMLEPHKGVFPGFWAGLDALDLLNLVRCGFQH